MAGALDSSTLARTGRPSTACETDLMSTMTEIPLALVERLIRGAVEVIRTHDGVLPQRLPGWARGEIPDTFMAQATLESAGIRLAFSTAATEIELDVRASRMVPDEVVPIPPGVYELTVDGEAVARSEVAAGGRYVFTFADRSAAHLVPGPASTVRFAGLPPREKEVELWLPYTDAVEVLALRADAPIGEAARPTGPRWLHHGSSISHGYRADSILGTWPVVAARTAGVELTNVAFSGNAMLDPFTARTMRDAEADLISVKIGINIVGADAMRLRVFRPAVHGFLDTIRDGHPQTPLVVVSPVFCDPVEAVPGPLMQDPSLPYDWSIATGRPEEVAQGKLTLQVVRAELEAIVRARSATDPNLRYLDGLVLYGPDDAVALPLPDNVHPGPDAQRLIGERFAALALTPRTP